MIAQEETTMAALGVALLIMGAALLVAEAHLPGGVLGVAGAGALIAGGIVAILAVGGGAAVAVPLGVGLGVAAGAWTIVATYKAAGVRRVRARAGPEGLCGRVGVVRNWREPTGQVFVDGALWQARREWWGADQDVLGEGDEIVVERVSGLTLCVRRAEEWELSL
jgi:membrane-bound serine protease (ClpP class)